MVTSMTVLKIARKNWLAILCLLSVLGCNTTTKEHTVHFISYGNEKFKSSRERIKQEAETSGWFSEIKIYTPENIGEDFVKNHGDFLTKNPRGGGYWIWKPYVIWQHLLTMKDGDFLVYLDSGSTINLKGKARFDDYIAMTDNHRLGVLGFQMGFIEKCWTKSDAAEHLNVLHDKTIMDSGQVMATVVVLQKNKNSVAFAKLWYETVVAENYHFVDDSPSKTPNDACFQENRHDQSVFSLLIKKKGGLWVDDEVQNFTEQRPFRATRLRN